YSVRRARNIGESAGDKPARAAFGRDDHLLARHQRVVDPFGEGDDRGVEHYSSRGSSIVAVANATTPSPRPMKPSCSAVVALMATRPGVMPHASAITAFMAAACGRIFGASQTMVMSRLTMRPPRPVTSPAACSRKMREAAPFHC